MREPPASVPLISIDTGGTFTDALLVERASSSASRPGRRVVKVLSSSSLRARIVRDGEPSDHGFRVLVEVPTALEALGPLAADFVRGWRFEVTSLRGTIASAAAAADQASRSAGRTLLSLVVAGHGTAPKSGSGADLHAPWPAPVLAARLLLSCPAPRALPPVSMRLGTTRGTNALLEQRLDPVVLVTNEGLADALAIGDQRRDRLFAPSPRNRPLLHRVAIETTLRQDAGGAVIRELDESALLEALNRARSSHGVTHAAVLFMHAWRNPEPERRVAEVLRRAGLRRVVASHECTGTEGYLERGLAAVVDAALSSAVGDFLDAVRRELSPGSTLEIATSAASLRPDLGFPPRESILSGPAGGAAAVLDLLVSRRESDSEAGAPSPAARVPSPFAALGFDMGGTSTDAIRVTDRLPRRERTTIGPWTFGSPSLAIESVAAGGGSVCRFDHGVLRVGPESAGGMPGPACYGRGGPLTITDVDLLLGRADATRFAVPLDLDAAHAALDEIVRAQRAAGITRSADETLDALRSIADEAMAAALSAISVREGFDPSTHSLVCFGGAGGQHACPIAERLGIRRIVHPLSAGVLSATGMALLRRERVRSEGVHRPLSAPALRRAVEAARRAMSEESPPVPGATLVPTSVDAAIGWRGQPAVIEIEVPRREIDDEALVRAARARYREIFGAHPPESMPELSFVRVVAEWRGGEPESRPAAPPSPARAQEERVAPGVSAGEAPRASSIRQRMRSNGKWIDAAIIDRSRLAVGERIDGPAIVADETATLVIDVGWSGCVDGAHAMVLQRRANTAAARRSHEPEVLASSLASIAIEMGEQLRRTAVSVNVRDRLDASCGILDAAGRLASTAPHVPVHLGALGACVRSLLAMRPIRPGELIVTNDPGTGGSHLPDVTVVLAVGSRNAEPLAFAAARAHHAEIGGLRPGSMPPSARSLHEEGVVIPPTPIGSIDTVDLSPVARLLREAPFPSRAIDDNLADLAAAVAALRRGAELMHAFVREHGRASFVRTLEDLRRRSRARAVEAIVRLPESFDRSVEQRLDDGSPIRLRIRRVGERLSVDFTGSGPAHPGNLNAPRAVVRSAVMYALRVLIESHEPLDDRLLPLNDGLLEPVDLVIPRGLLDPPPGAPVAAGNTETSQRVVDALLLALGIAACSQGTMNNLAMGGVLADGRHWSFYETIAGGCGATHAADGASGLHSHMTNTRITDPETLERRAPLRLARFAYRQGSGGARSSAAGHAGGDGLVREIEFLSEAEVSFISQRRMSGPDGLGPAASIAPDAPEASAPAGAPGHQWLLRSGTTAAEPLPGIAEFRAIPGDRLRIETPGGGAAA